MHPARTRTRLVDLAHVWSRYWRKHRRRPRLFAPQRYTEKMQWRKLFDHDVRHTILCDKLALRDYLAVRGGGDLLVPLLWSGTSPDDVPIERFTEPYILKCTHGNAMNIFIDRPERVDASAVRGTLRRWLGRNHGIGLVEPGHIAVTPRIVAESMLREPDGRPPTEYKFFTFGPSTALIAIRLNMDHHLHSNLHVLPDWTPTPLKLDTPLYEGPIPDRPPEFDRMRTLAERIGAEFDHLRVDFYRCNGRLYLGEVSLYSQSGMVPLDPDEYDLWLGGLWDIKHPTRRALQALSGYHE